MTHNPTPPADPARFSVVSRDGQEVGTYVAGDERVTLTLRTGSIARIELKQGATPDHMSANLWFVMQDIDEDDSYSWGAFVRPGAFDT